MQSSLSGRTVVVAGGSGGLGAATTRMLAGEGARVVVSYARNAERAAKAAWMARRIQSDLRVAEDRAKLLDAARELYGLVVFAGAAARSDELTEESLAVNYIGPVRLAREAAAGMKRRGEGGAIVLIASMQGIKPFEGTTPYAAPKAALIQAARILAKECRGPAGIRVNVIAPGVMEAGIALESIAAGKYQRYIDERVVERYGRPEDVARAVRFFLEPDNYVTGQVLLVDGGLTL